MALNNPLVGRTFSRAKSLIFRVSRAVSEHRGISLLALLTLFVAGVIVPLLGQQKAERRGGEEHDSAALIRKRAEWFFKQRAFPLGHIPADARQKAIQQMEEMRRTQGTLMDRFAAQAQSGVSPEGAIGPLSKTTWTSIGPQPTNEPVFFGLTSGRVNAIAVDACDTTGNTVYIAGAQGGVWKTLDGGATWKQLTDNQPSISGGSLALDSNLGDCSGGAPTSGGQTGAIYFGTGEENFSGDSFYGAGVLISHDGGTTWTKDTTFATLTPSPCPTASSPCVIVPQGSQFAGPFIGAIAVDPATSGTSQVLLAAVQSANGSGSGIWRSTNGGSSWTPVPPVAGSNAFGTAVAFDPSDAAGNTAYAALGTPGVFNGIDSANNGIYKSTNGGQSWTRVQPLDTAVNSALGNGTSGNYGRISFALAPATSSPSPMSTEIVVAIADITTGSSNLLGDAVNTPAIFISTNGGAQFSAVSTNSSAGAGGFCDSQCFYDISIGIDPKNPNDIFLGGGPNANGGNNAIGGQPGLSSVIFSGGGSFTDVSFDNASGLFVHVDTHAFAFAHPSGGGTIVYVGNDGGVWSSSNVESNPGNQVWNDLNKNLSLTQFYAGNSIHPSNPQIVFAGAQDNGTQKFDPTFNPANPQETQNVDVCGDGSATAIDPMTPSTVYATCEDIGQIGQNPVINKNQLDGEPGTTPTLLAPNWIPLDTPAIDADNADFVPPLALDPLTPQNIYFATCRVWQSTTGGISWADISGALDGSARAGAPCPAGSITVTTMVVAPTDSSTLYVGTDAGEVFATSTANLGSGATFKQINQNVSATPGRTVTQIVGSPASNKVAYIGFSGFSSCPGCDGKGHIFKFDGTVGNGTFTNLTGNLPDTPDNDIVVDPNDVTSNTIYVATDVGVFGTTNGGSTWLPLAGGLPHIECLSLKLNNTARVLMVGTHGRGEWELLLPGVPAFALTGISPASVTAGQGSLLLVSVSGTGFTTSSVVNLNGAPAQTTTFISATQLTATLAPSAIAAAGNGQITVANGATTSNALNFSIEGPAPTLGNVMPASVSSTASPVTITVTGGSFTANTGLVWTPGLGSAQQGNKSLISQNAGSLMGSGNNMSFTVTVPATLLQSTLSRVAPIAPRRPMWPDSRFWLLAAAFAGALGILLFAFVQRKRRLILGTTVASVVVLLSIAGCGGSNNNNNRPGSVTVGVQVYTPGPGGGLEPATPAPDIVVQ